MGSAVPLRGLGALAVLALSAGEARAQNAEGFHFSEDAARSAGAVTAHPGDDGSLWYNPAGLAAVERGRITANGSVFGLRIRHIPAAVETRVNGARASLDLDATDVVAAPHTVAMTYHLTDGVTLGVGLFTTERDVRKAADLVIGAPAPGVPGGVVTQRLDVQIDRSTYHAGAGVGLTVARGVRLGVAPLVSYRTRSALLQYALATGSDDGGSVEIAQGSVAETLVGLTASIGVQIDLDRVVHLGLTARPPELFLGGDSGGGTLVAVADDRGDDPIVLGIEEAPPPRSGSSMIAPARVGAGVWLTPSPRLAVGMDVELRTGLDNPALALALDPVWNGRIGVRLAWSDELVVGAGLFTDFAPESEPPAALGDEVVDWVGGTVGATLRTPLALAKEPDEPEALVLSTTLALRYAVGIGRAGALALDDDAITNPVRDVTYHDVMPFLGSSIQF